MEPAKAYVSELAPFWNRLNPSIRSEPKFNVTLMRLNKDMRFAKGEPYKNYFLIHFGRFKLDSEFFVYFAPDEIQMGLFINNSKGDKLFFPSNIEKYQKEIKSIFSKYSLENKYSLYELKKESIKICGSFDSKKHFEKLKSIQYILLQKIKIPARSKIYSDGFVIETMKIFTSLYPVYCFAISQSPLKEIENFEENFGSIV